MCSPCSTTAWPTSRRGQGPQRPRGFEGLAGFPDSQLDAVVESAEECPGECIFIECIFPLEP